MPHIRPLTAGVDTSGVLIGSRETTSTAGNDIFNATHLTFSALDAIDGGAGTDRLNIDAGANNFNSATAINATVAGVETVRVTSTTGDLTLNSTRWSNNLIDARTDSGKVVVTAAATQDVAVSNTAAPGAGAVVVTGGRDVNVVSVDSATTGAASGNTIVVGSSATGGAPAGAVTVSAVEVISDGGNAGIATGTIDVIGGTSVAVNSSVAVGVGNNAADVVTLGAINVSGNGTATSVAVTQTAATATWAASGDNIKITNGAVNINDRGTANLADTISSVTLTNFGATAINSNVLSNLTLRGGTFSTTADTSSGAVTITQTNGIKTTGAIPTALTLNMVAGSVGVITDASDQYRTLTVNSAAASRIAGLDFTNVTAVNFTGAGLTTVTALTDLAPTAVITSGAAGVTLIGALNGTGVTFTGGDGVDTINLTAVATTKAITTGAGNDNVTMSVAVGTDAFGVKGSVDAGAGTDTLVMTAANAAALSGSAFEDGISGFEVLSLGAVVAGATNTVDVSLIDDISTVSAAGTSATRDADTVTIAVTGAVTAGETITTTIDGVAVLTTLVLADTTGSNAENAAAAAARVAADINANTALRAVGVSASATAGVVTISGRGDGTATSVAVAETLANGTAVAADTVNEVAGGILNVVNLGSANSVTFTGAITGATGLQLASAIGTTDVVNVGFRATAGFTNFAALSVANVETLNITTADTSGVVTAFTAPVSATSATAVTVSGNAGIDLSGNTLSTVMASFDASGVTGTGTAGAVRLTTGNISVSTTLTGGAGDDVINASAAQTLTRTVTINGGAGNDTLTGSASLANTINGGDGIDTIVGGSGADTLNGGNGNDTITTNGGLDVVTGGAGIDTIVLTATGTSSSVYAAITDLAAGDRIDFANSSAAGTFNRTQISLAATATFADYLNAATLGNATGAVSWFQFGGNTYMVQDINANTNGFVGGSDVLVQLNGLLNLANSAIDGTTNNIFTFA